MADPAFDFSRQNRNLILINFRLRIKTVTLLTSFLTSYHCAFVFAAPVGALGVPGVSPRAQSEDDGSEETGSVSSWGLKRSGSPQSP